MQLLTTLLVCATLLGLSESFYYGINNPAARQRLTLFQKTRSHLRDQPEPTEEPSAVPPTQEPEPSEVPEVPTSKEPKPTNEKPAVPPTPKTDDESKSDSDESSGEDVDSASSEEYNMDDNDWPYAIMEFSSLVGKCVAAEMLWKTTKPSDGVLVSACPHVMKAANHYAAADEATRERAEKFTEKAFQLLQCVNLAAEAESVKYLSQIIDYEIPEVFMKEGKPLWDMCEDVFDDAEKLVDEWTEKFDTELAPTEEPTPSPEPTMSFRFPLLESNLFKRKRPYQHHGKCK